MSLTLDFLKPPTTDPLTQRPFTHRPTDHLPTDPPTGYHELTLKKRPDSKHLLYSKVLENFLSWINKYYFHAVLYIDLIFDCCRSSRRRCSIKKVFLEILHDSQENTCARASFLIKLQALRRCFPVNFTKILRTPFLQNTSGRVPLLLD